MFQTMRRLKTYSRSTFRSAVSVGVLTLVTVGCVVGPEFTKPAVTKPEQFSVTPVVAVPAVSHWSEVFANEELSGLIRKVGSQNLSLEALYQRTLRARAIIASENARRRPQIQAQGSYQRFEDSEELGPFGFTDPENLHSAGLTAGWELDLFGRIRHLVNAAWQEAEATAAAYEGLRLLVETDVAMGYFRLQALAGELDAVERSVTLRKASLEIVRKRFESGVVSDLDVAQAETLLANAEAELASLRLDFEVREHAMAVLVGEVATDFSIARSGIEGAPPMIPVGLPSELLQRRPDIREAESQMRRRSALVGVATADFYPRITLGGDVGLSAFDADDWFEKSAGTYGFGPQITVPLLQGGRLRAGLEASKREYAAAMKDYQQVIIEAFAEVENALAGVRHLSVQRAARERAASAAIRAQSLSEKQYSSGLIDFITALDSERSALTAKRLRARVIGAEFENIVLLIRAIGGTWQDAGNQEASPNETSGTA